MAYYDIWDLLHNLSEGREVTAVKKAPESADVRRAGTSQQLLKLDHGNAGISLFWYTFEMSDSTKIKGQLSFFLQKVLKS